MQIEPWWCLILLLPALGWALARFHLRGPDLRAFDQPLGQQFGQGRLAGAEHAAVVASLGNVKQVLAGVPRRQHIAVLRRYLDDAFDVDWPASGFTPVDAGGVPAEWVQYPGADPDRRLLYIHGGAFTMGSARSHRRLTTALAQRTGGVVLAIDYRLMPEHPRAAGMEDCRTAYRWLIDHGPQGPAAASRLWVAGDSAGGNLTLSLIAWVRDSGLRAPNAAAALSPATDSTLVNPSLRHNIASDPMLGPLFGRLARVPNALMLWLSWLRIRINPRDPRISPVYGSLSGLPPVLVQASEAEMLRDDARRYANRAAAAGSPVKLQTWAHMVHVWQIYHPQLAEGREALDEIGRFFNAN